jgi:hypothetical protein
MRSDCIQNIRWVVGTGLLILALAAGGIRADEVAAARGATATAMQPAIDDPGPRIPDGFTQIFNGKDLTGWHVSKTNHHGTTPDYRVVHGLIVARRIPVARGHSADGQEI